MKYKKENATKVNKKWKNIQDLIDGLKEFCKQEKNIVTSFGGKQFYSMFDNEDSVYLAIFGKNKKDFMLDLNEILEEREKEIKEKRQTAIESASKWINEGEQYINIQKCIEWRKQVYFAVTQGEFYGEEIEIALEIMKSLYRTKNTSEGISILNSCAKDELKKAVRDIVLAFADNGKQFYLDTTSWNISFDEENLR